MAGFKTIGRDRVLLLTTIQVSLQTVIAGALTVFLVVMADEILDSPESGLGALNAVIGVGSILGGMVAIARSHRSALGRDLTAGVVLWSLPLVLVAVWPTPVACFVAVALLGLANPLVDVNLDTIFQRTTPDQMLGRVFGALESCAIGTMALGALLMPLLLSVMSLRSVAGGDRAPGRRAGADRAARDDPVRRQPRAAARARAAAQPRPLHAARPVDHGGAGPGADRGAVRRGRRAGHRGRGVRPLLRDRVGPGRGHQDRRPRRAGAADRGPGEYFGEIGLLRDVPRTATITALEETVVLTLTRDHFLRAVSGDRESGRAAEATVRRRLAT